MHDVASKSYRLLQLPAAAALAIALIVGAGVGHAQSPQPASAMHTVAAELSVAELERTFWVCDWSATAGRLEGADFARCAIVADELKARRFGGDFHRMIEWWQQNKAGIHAGLQGERLAATQRR